jgi:hypothetical protein
LHEIGHYYDNISAPDIRDALVSWMRANMNVVEETGGELLKRKGSTAQQFVDEVDGCGTQSGRGIRVNFFNCTPNTFSL